MNIVELLAESWRAFRSSPVAALLIALLTAGMGAITMASAGSSAATYDSISNSLTAPEARTFKLTDGEQQVLGTTVVETVRSLSSVERALAMTTPQDVVAGNLGQDSTPVPLTHISGDVEGALALTAGRMPGPHEVIIGPGALEALRLVDGVGYVESSAGQQWAVVGTFTARPPFTDLNTYAISTDRADAYARLHVVARNLETLAGMERNVSDVVGEYPGVEIAKVSAAASAAESLKLMGILRSSGAANVARTMGAGLLIVFGVVFADVLLHARDLGRRRTLGITRSQLVAFIQLRVAYSALLGAAIGVLGAHIALATRDVAVPWTFALATFILTVAAAVLAAFTPGVVAAYRDPVTVMRTHI